MNAALDDLKKAKERHERVLFGHFDDAGTREIGLVDALTAIRFIPRIGLAIVGLLGVITAKEVLSVDAWKFVVHLIGGSP